MKQLSQIFLMVCALTFMIDSSMSWAAAPKMDSNAPGYYRIKVGDFEVTAISDGTVDLPMSKLLTKISPADYKKMISKNFLTDPIETSDNAYLINTGSKLVLIDTGAGKLFGPTLGRFLVHLKASGYNPEQVDAILITHMHGDHVGGLLADNKMVFPNATLYADKAEADYWLSADNMAKAPEDKKAFFKGAMAVLEPYVKAGKLTTLTEDTEIFPGIKTHSSHGHTPGHTAYIVESNGQKLVLWGDLIHVAAVQFEKPLVSIQFDYDQKMAEGQRLAALSEAAKQGYLIAATHLPFPGLGHVRSEKKAYRYVPVNYTR